MRYNVQKFRESSQHALGLDAQKIMGQLQAHSKPPAWGQKIRACLNLSRVFWTTQFSSQYIYLDIIGPNEIVVTLN